MSAPFFKYGLFGDEISLVVALVTFYAVWYYYGLPRKTRKIAGKPRN